MKGEEGSVPPQLCNTSGTIIGDHPPSAATASTMRTASTLAVVSLPPIGSHRRGSGW